MNRKTLAQEVGSSPSFFVGAYATAGWLCRATRSVSLPPLDYAAYRTVFSLEFFAMLQPGEILKRRDANHAMAPVSHRLTPQPHLARRLSCYTRNSSLGRSGPPVPFVLFEDISGYGLAAAPF